VAVSAQVRDDQSIVVPQSLYLVGPQRAVQREAMDEKQDRSVAYVLVIHLETVDQAFQTFSLLSQARREKTF
jgi:hypothetical protein